MKDLQFQSGDRTRRDFDVDPSGWDAYCPALKTLGATETEALTNINDVVRMVMESMLEHGGPIPQQSAEQGEMAVEPRVAVTI